MTKAQLQLPLPCEAALLQQWAAPRACLHRRLRPWDSVSALTFPLKLESHESVITSSLLSSAGTFQGGCPGLLCVISHSLLPPHPEQSPHLRCVMPLFVPVFFPLLCCLLKIPILSLEAGVCQGLIPAMIFSAFLLWVISAPPQPQGPP